jgi:replication factor A2
MWGFEYKMITLVALVRNIDHSSTKLTYELKDLTGRINAHLWIEEGDSENSGEIKLNTYVRVIGAVRQQGDSKMIMIYKILPVSGINEVNTHYLEVINARYQAEEYYKGGSGVVKMDVDGGSVQHEFSSTQEGPQGKTSLIFNAIRIEGEKFAETGVNRSVLAKKFPQMNAAEITKIIDELINDGHVYSTVDADHFLACN